jgi:sensor domain CHASE-containing protein
MSSSEFPAALITTVLLVIAVAAVVVVVVALVITRSLRAKAQQYAPPGQPTPLGQTHQHMTASLKPVLQQSIGRVCPKCGAAVAREAATCPKCGTRL